MSEEFKLIIEEKKSDLIDIHSNVDFEVAAKAKRDRKNKKRLEDINKKDGKLISQRKDKNWKLS